MKLIVGLGNPGREYLWTRHNFGALAVDFWAIQSGAKWQEKSAFYADVAEITKGVLLAKPDTFYNESGRAVQAICRFYKLDPKQDLLVVCDDFQLPFGEMRLRESGSDGGNNGLKSVIQTFGTQFARLRLGTDAPLRKQAGDTDFVLGRWSAEEKAALSEILNEATTAMERWAKA
jgi:PTH1 family peptidyl-tRNA hydrolase